MVLSNLVFTRERIVNISYELLRAMQRLWNDLGLQYCLKSQSAPNHYDPMTVSYFLSRLDDIGSQDYVPTIDDVLRMRVQVEN
jgi:hypothetical protein